MSGLIKAVIAFVLSNYFLTFLVIGLLFSAVAIARAKRPPDHQEQEPNPPPLKVSELAATFLGPL